VKRARGGGGVSHGGVVRCDGGRRRMGVTRGGCGGWGGERVSVTGCGESAADGAADGAEYVERRKYREYKVFDL
jgi:hypothetical protein